MTAIQYIKLCSYITNIVLQALLIFLSTLHQKPAYALKINNIIQ